MLAPALMPLRQTGQPVGSLKAETLADRVAHAALRVCGMRQLQELRAGSRVVAQQPAGGDRDGVRAQRPDPAARHAQVLGRQNDAHTPAFQLLFQKGGDLLAEFLLDLHSGGERLHGPGQLGQASDPVARQHPHLGDPGKRQHMMGADRGERHVPGQH